ncbi:MAG: UDP-glucose 4-epimerase GalE [Thermoleophilia bacterium]
MNILVTGGAGYIGSAIAAKLVDCGHRVVVYDSLFRGHRAAVHPAASLIVGDIRDADRLRDALVDGSCQAIIHMAALAEVAESVRQPDLYHSVNVEGTRAVIEAARATRVDRLVFSSTAAVYGEPTRTPIDEDDPLLPTNPYGESKLAAERLLQEAQRHDRLAFTALRYFNACGALRDVGEDHAPETHLIPLALEAARSHKPIRVFGDDYPTPDGTCVRDYVHVADLADAHIAALSLLPAVHGVLNLGTGSGDSVRHVLDTVEKTTGIPLIRERADRRPGDPPTLVASSRRAAATLGWRPQRSLDDAVRDAWGWMQSHPRGYDHA